MHCSTLLLGVTLFVATNVDDIFVLLAFFADTQFKPREVVFGQFLGITTLVLISVVAALVSLIIPTTYVGLLGLCPIFLGVKQLVELWKDSGDSEVRLDQKPKASPVARMLMVTAVTIANGGDNIGVYAPLFAVKSGLEIAIISGVFAVMTLLWCLLAYQLVYHKTIGNPIRRYGYRAMPFVLIAIGSLVIYEAKSYQLFMR